ncbi:hypothetical protein GW17_00016772 [Ensete ventricosum]|nr:hypothetical protein GW17_00016772 [Ensete ventricosum]
MGVKKGLNTRTMQVTLQLRHAPPFLLSVTSNRNVALDDAENAGGASKNLTAASEPTPAWASRGIRSKAKTIQENPQTHRTLLHQPISEAPRKARRLPLLGFGGSVEYVSSQAS